MQEKRKKILIVDDNDDFTEVLNEYLSYQNEFDIIGIAKNGLSAIKLITENEPDIVLLDIIMPYLDGLGLLEKINSLELKKKPLFIMISSAGQDKISQMALSLGAQFFMVKPFDMETLVSRIKQLDLLNMEDEDLPSPENMHTIPEKKSSEDRIENKVTKIMQEAGIPSHLKGYHYLRDAILMAVDDKTLLDSVHGRLYPALANRYNSMPYKVEGAIRNAVELALDNISENSESPFYNLNLNNSKPTSSEFILLVAEKLK